MFSSLYRKRHFDFYFDVLTFIMYQNCLEIPAEFINWQRKTKLVIMTMQGKDAIYP